MSGPSCATRNSRRQAERASRRALYRGAVTITRRRTGARRDVISAAAVACFGGFVAAVEALSALEPGYSDRQDQISDLLVGSHPGWARAAFVVLAGGGALLAWRQRHTGALTSTALAAGYAVAVLVTGLTVPGHAPHGVAAASAFTLAPLVVATAPQLPRRARAGFVVLVVLSFATWAAGPGLGERITAYLEIAGLVWLAAAGPARA